MGLAAYFLYVPNNLGMQGVLTTCLVTVGALKAMQYAGDNWRGAVSAGLAILPVATRYIVFEVGLLSQVLADMLDNAIKFSSEDSRVMLALRPAGKLWNIQVRDAGPGIATASQGQVFEEFVQPSNP